MPLRLADGTPISSGPPAMTLLVDDLRRYPHAPLPLKLWCHLVSDVSFEELHGFAARLGIPRERFQGDHYDLPPWLRASAVALGAAEVDTGELIARMHGPRGDRARRRRAAAPARRVDTP